MLSEKYGIFNYRLMKNLWWYRTIERIKMFRIQNKVE